MAADAFMVAYDVEMIQAYRRVKSFLKDRVTTRGIVQGNQFVFDVYGSAADTTVTRGATGDIPYAQTNQTQATLQMAQKHAAKEKNGFNIFSCQGDQRRAMQEDVVGIANRSIDAEIITELANATQVTSTTESMTVQFSMKAVVKLLQGDAYDGMVTGVITPAAFGYLMQNDQVSSKDFVDTSMFPNAPRVFRWAGAEWLVHSGLTGMGTSSETMYLFHRAGIGYGMDTAGMKNAADYEQKHDRSWARCSYYGGPKLLQNTGIVKILHDGSGIQL